MHIATEEEAKELTQALADAHRPSPAQIVGAAFSEEVNTTPVTAYYFDEAIMAFFHRDLYRFRTPQDRCRHTIPTWETDWRGEAPLGVLRPGSHLLMPKFAEYERVMCIYLVKDTGVQLLDYFDLDTLRTDILEPAKFNAVKVGEGAEGEVFLYTVGDRQFIVKLFSLERLNRMNEIIGRMLRTRFSGPEFLKRTGIAKRIIDEFRDWPKRWYRLSTLVEYAVSPKYILMEPGPSVTLEDLFIASGLKEPTKDLVRYEEAALMLKKSAISIEDLRRVAFEIKQLADFSDIAVYGSHGLFQECRLAPDFVPQNFLVRGFDAAARMFDLVLIDQGAAAIDSSNDPVFGPQQLWHYRQMYQRLMQMPMYRQYLEAHQVGYPEYPK